MSETVTAVPLNPNELLLEGTVEIRPCRVCRIRLTIPSTALGKLVSCPSCGCAERALAAEGPFASVSLEAEPPQPLVHLALAAPPAVIGPTVAPVVPYRHIDPIDERSPMVDAVGQLLWVSGAFILVGAIYQAASFWKQDSSTEQQELSVYASTAIRVLAAGLVSLASVGVMARSGWGWWLGMLASLGILAGIAYELYERNTQPLHAAGHFDLGILLKLPSFLIAVFTLVLFVTPRYYAEFRTGRNAG